MRAVRAAGMTWLLVGLVALLGCATFAAQAGAASSFPFAPVAGSPFLTSNGPASVAFNGHGFLAVANGPADSVSIYKQASNGAPTLSGSPITLTGGHPDWVAFSPDGAVLAVALLNSNKVAMFKVSGTGSATPVATYDSGGTSPKSVAFGVNGSQLLMAVLNGPSGGQPGTIGMFKVDATTGVATAVTGSPFTTGVGAASVAFSRDGKLLAAADSGGTGSGDLRMFKLDSSTFGLTLASSVASAGNPQGVAFSPTASLVASANGPSGKVAVYSYDDASGTLSVAPGSPVTVGFTATSVAFSPDGGTLAASTIGTSGAGAAAVFTVGDAATGSAGTLTAVAGEPFAAGVQPFAIAFDPAGSFFATANTGGNGVSVFAAVPSARIIRPASGGIYRTGDAVGTQFSCGPGPDRTPATGCTDSGGSSAAVRQTGAGNLDTSTNGTHTYTVTATAADGQIGTSSITYTVPGPPSVVITSPADGETYRVGAAIASTFACADFYPPVTITSCSDSNGSTGTAGHLNTASAGLHTYAVTARSSDGQAPTKSITYTVAGAPSEAIDAPRGGRTYYVGQGVPTRFHCGEGTAGPGVQSCTDSSGASSPSGQLDTSAAGPQTYAVIVVSDDGQTAIASLTYNVLPEPPTPRISSASQSAARWRAAGRAPAARRRRDSLHAPGLGRNDELRRARRGDDGPLLRPAAPAQGDDAERALRRAERRRERGGRSGRDASARIHDHSVVVRIASATARCRRDR